MIFTPDWSSRIIDCDSSITDIPAAHLALRALESSQAGMLHPPIINYKELGIGGGAVFPSIEFINGYKLRFPVAGSYVISGGNLLATIAPVSGVYIERNFSAAYAVTSTGGGGGGGGATAQEIAQAVWEESTAQHVSPGTFGRLVNGLLTLAKFLSFK